MRCAGFFFLFFSFIANMSPKSKTNNAVTTQIPLAAVAYDFFSWSCSVVCQRVWKLQPFTPVPRRKKDPTTTVPLWASEKVKRDSTLEIQAIQLLCEFVNAKRR